MKCLKIESGKAFYSVDGKIWKEMTQLDRIDLLALVNNSVQDDFEMDFYVKDAIKNPADDIIYKNLHIKLEELTKNKGRFKDESQQLYRDALLKYQTSAPSENVSG